MGKNVDFDVPDVVVVDLGTVMNRLGDSLATMGEKGIHAKEKDERNLLDCRKKHDRLNYSDNIKKPALKYTPSYCPD